MTANQRITLMVKWWPDAARAVGWNVDDRDLRLRVLSVAVSLFRSDNPNRPTIVDIMRAVESDEPLERTIESANQLQEREDIDAVKSMLQMLADSVTGASEFGNPEIGRARRLREVINELVMCLRLYHPAPEAYLASVIRGKFNHGSRVTEKTVADLDAKQLDQLVYTMDRALRQKRKVTGDSEHDMRSRAGLPCRKSCSQCARALSLATAGAVPKENIPF